MNQVRIGELSLSRILNSQTVIINSKLNKSLETINIPRYLLDKHSSIFKKELEYHDIADPAHF